MPYALIAHAHAVVMECQYKYNLHLMLSARLVKNTHERNGKLVIESHAVTAAMMLAKPLCSQQDAVAPD